MLARAWVLFLAGVETGGRVVCSGTFYKAHAVVTAATCAQGPVEDYWVREDSNMTNRFKVLKKVIHPSYKYDKTPSWNVAVLFLKRPKAPYKRVKLNIGKHSGLLAPNLKLTGWKITSTDTGYTATIESLSLRLKSVTLCSAGYVKPLDPSHEFCTGLGNSGRGSCAFLPGTPIYYLGLIKAVVVGIISWNRPCALFDLAPIFTDIASVEGWLTKISTTI
ncbi:hypothetical protein DSO57_1017362 [Entomophthora muscae]|uniref:Uncharacterized protein n=1 Tax=Entomophthora muscae TaxID=34485 RepID=A0ACC2T4L9_9FUNG|nr:hypothetical protein DSO57_1017362 [Entomophthora muscae]